VIDLHCHILPGIDDGPETLEGSVAMARTHIAAGVATVAATPHVDWEYGNRAADVREGLPALRAAIAAAGLDLQVIPGGEVSLTLSADLPDEELRALTLGDGPWLLLETPLSQGAVGFERIVQQVQMRGHRVLLAHPERCPAVQRDVEVLETLVRGGVLCQLTAGSFTGQFGREIQRLSLELVARGLVHVVASDSHDTVRRPPG